MIEAAATEGMYLSDAWFPVLLKLPLLPLRMTHFHDPYHGRGLSTLFLHPSATTFLLEELAPGQTMVLMERLVLSDAAVLR